MDMKFWRVSMCSAWLYFSFAAGVSGANAKVDADIQQALDTPPHQRDAQSDLPPPLLDAAARLCQAVPL